MKYLCVFLVVGLTSLVNAQTETVKQPSCDEMEGFQTADLDLVPEDYTGVVKYCRDGKVTDLVNYKDGKKNGLFRRWQENGQLWIEQNYKDGLRDGLQRDWYDNGQLWYEKNYKEGKKDGLHRGWHEDGQLHWEKNYKDGNLLSEKCWNKDGNEEECTW